MKGTVARSASEMGLGDCDVCYLRGLAADADTEIAAPAYSRNPSCTAHIRWANCSANRSLEDADSAHARQNPVIITRRIAMQRKKPKSP